MGNSTGKFTVSNVLNRVLNSTDDKLKAIITGITIAQGSTFPIKNYLGFTQFEFQENGDLHMKGDIIKI